MKHNIQIFTLSALAALALFACTHSNNIQPDQEFSCLNFPSLQPDLPFDVDLPNHPNVQCFAWQEFIALNWPADPGQAGEPDRRRNARTWGDPGSSRPSVWETFKEAHEVFLPDAADPAPWGERALSSSFSSGFVMASMEGGGMAMEMMTQESGMHAFRMTSKVSPRARLERTDQAVGGPLTGQNGELTYYGIHMNRRAFDYIVSERFFDAAEQQGTQIDFPVGLTGLGDDPNAQQGAILIKSAWLDLDGFSKKRKKRFHRARACLVESNRCRWATVGLVGLHILQKTETFPQWTWATFEHVDNAPDRDEVRRNDLRRRYNYHDPNCPSSRDCRPNQSPVDPTNPVQVVRLTPIAEDASRLNQRVHREIRRANRDSVWQHYQLVDVQWPEGGEAIPALRDAPLPLGAPRPTAIANTTLETYVQRETCLECHQGATVAPSGGTPSRQAADYTFLLSLADDRP